MQEIMRAVVKNNELSRDRGKGLREGGGGGGMQGGERERQRRRAGMRKSRKRDKEVGGLTTRDSL